VFSKFLIEEKYYLYSAVVITNPSRTFFYLQQKDEGYQIESFRLSYCFFGGRIEEGEEEKDSLRRELFEELESIAADLVFKNSKRLFYDCFTNILGRKCRFLLYESVISDKNLEEISTLPVKEGKRGFLCKREELLIIPFISDLKNTRRRYLKFIENY